MGRVDKYKRTRYYLKRSENAALRPNNGQKRKYHTLTTQMNGMWSIFFYQTFRESYWDLGITVDWLTQNWHIGKKNHLFWGWTPPINGIKDLRAPSNKGRRGGACFVRLPSKMAVLTNTYRTY